MFSHNTPFNIILEVLPNAIMQVKEIKCTQIGKKDINLSLFTDDDYLCIKSKRINLKKLLKLIIDYSKVAGYKVNIEKSIMCLYTNNEQIEFEITNTISFTLAPPKMKYLGINLIKYVQIYMRKTTKI